MAKFHRILNNADSYFRKGMESSNEGEYIRAIDYFFRAYELDDEKDKPETLMEIGACYSLLGEHDSALKAYYKALAVDAKSESAFVGVISSLIALNKNSEAIYYINYSDAKNIIGDDYDVSVTNRNTFKVVGKYDREATIFVARKLMANGEYAYAKKILEEIPSQSKDYVEALNLIAMICLGEQKYLQSAIICDSVLARQPENIDALTTKIVALHYSANLKERDECVSVLTSLSVTKEQEVRKIAVCMQQIQNEEYSLKYYKKLLEFTPYDKTSNLIVAILYHNTGKHAAAHSAMVRLSKLYPDCETVKFYALNIREESDKFEISASIPQSEQERRLDEVNDKLSKLKTTEKAVNYAKKHREFYNLLKWTISSPQAKIAGHVASFLAQHTYFHPMIREMLVNPDVNYYPKRECLPTFLEFAQKKNFAIYSQDVVQFFKPRIPKLDVQDVLKNIYWAVYANCVFLTCDFDKNLNAKYKSFIKRITEEDNVKLFSIADKASLSALLAHYTELHPVFSDVKSLARVFDTDEKRLQSMLDLFNKTEEKK
ncbi:MAG: hypothetical protein J6C23_05395 [Clostridia bacterium]|nr:hypothetical protein [Clostridia bacterium]